MMRSVITSRQQKLRGCFFWGSCVVAVGVAAPARAEAPQPQQSAGEGISMRRVAHVDESGLRIEMQYGEAPAAPPLRRASGTPPSVIWHAVDAASITNSVALSDSTDETWVGHNLNFERLAYHQTTGDGTPIYELDLPDNPGIVAVGSAEENSLGVLLVRHAGSGVSVKAFDAGSGNTPLWTYDFANNVEFTGYRNVDVSADGSIVIAAARDAASESTVVILDGVTGLELDSLTVSAILQGVELSDDGGRAVLTESATARIIDTSTMGTLFSFSVSGGGGYHRISRDGATVAAGGFNCLAYHESGGVWSQVFSFAQAQNWFGAGLALSANGDTLFLVTYNYNTGYVDLTYRVIDLINDVVLAQTSTLGTLGLQDAVQQAQASADGQIFSVISWGSADNAHPELQIFDRDLNLIGEIDTPGSPFSLDMSRDGQFVVIGGKSVHANTSGNGSDTYAYQVFAGCPADLNGDGEVGPADLAALLAMWGPCPGCPADFNGDDEVGPFDLATLLAVWGPCG